MATGWVKPEPLSTAQKAAYARTAAVSTLGTYFCDNVILHNDAAHNPGHTERVIRALLKAGHSEQNVRGLLEDVVYLSQEAFAGRKSLFKIKSVGLLPFLMESYDPDTKRVGSVMGGRSDSVFDPGDLVVVGGG
jgi:hypothetical protein